MSVTSSFAPGLLLAAPPLGDPNFERTVIVLGHHDSEGALGWVINGRALVPVNQLLRDADLTPAEVKLPEKPSFAASVRVGGPVMPGSAWLLYRRTLTAGPYEGDHDLSGGLAMTSAPQAIETIAKGEGPEEFRLFLGYAGWAPGQVESEIQAGAWLPAPLNPSLLLSSYTDPNEIWTIAYQQSLGIIPMAFTSTRRGSA